MNEKTKKDMWRWKRDVPRVGLALSGGSAFGIAHVGAVRALREADVIVSSVAGTSAGAIVAACVAFGVSDERMIEATRRLGWSNIADFGYSKLGLNSNRPVGKLVTALIGDVLIEDAPIPLSIVATDIDTGEKVVFRKGSLAEAVMASTCIPGFFVPVELGGRRLVDGGIVENLPLPSLRNRPPAVPVGVDLGHWILRPAKNVLDVVTNSYGILARGQRDFRETRDAVIVRPHLERFSVADFKQSEKLMDAGYRAMRSKVPVIRRRYVVARYRLWNPFSGWRVFVSPGRKW